MIHIRHKKLNISIIVLLAIVFNGLQAQNSLVIKEKTGTITNFNLKNIRLLTFSKDSLLVHKTDGNLSNYAIIGIHYLDFENVITNSNDLEDRPSSDITIYPNPVNDKLHVSFTILNTDKMEVEIIDLKGNILLQQTINCQTGTNNATIDVEQLHIGFYLCHIQIGNIQKTINFIKN